MSQGSTLCCSLFWFYINAIPVGPRSTIRLCADKIIAYMALKSTNDAQHLQLDLDKLAIWDGILIVLSVTRYTIQIKFNYTLHGHPNNQTRFKMEKKLNNTARRPMHILDFSVEILNISSTSIKEQTSIKIFS